MGAWEVGAWEDEMAEGGDDTDEQPNVPFVPLKEIAPSIPSREFGVYLILLVVFMVNLRTQNLTEDYEVNSGVKGMVKLHGFVGSFNNIETAEDYVQWWPNLRGALQRWDQNVGVDEAQADLSANGNSAAAVLVGLPYITQKVRLDKSDLLLNDERADSAAGDVLRVFGNSSEDRGLPGFNSTNGAACPWPVDPTSRTCFYKSTGKTWGSSWELFGGTTCAKSCDNVAPEDQVYYLPSVRGVLNGTYDWSPADWIGPRTQELGHHFTLYLASEKRFATGTVKLIWEDTGRLSRVTDFETHEPFAHETNPYGFYLEMIFFAAIVYHLREELAEIWDCICLTELLLPIEILATSLSLEMLRIQYVHERTAEVYDPRDPETAKGFEFPDTEDMQKHHEKNIMPRQNLRHNLELELLVLKTTMEEEPTPISRSTHQRFHQKVENIQIKLLELDAEISYQSHVGDVASILQLSVMWANKWTMHFPAGFIQQLSGTTGEQRQELDKLRGKEVFCAVNWIDVARDYVQWDRDDVDDDGQHRGEDRR